MTFGSSAALSSSVQEYYDYNSVIASPARELVSREVVTGIPWIDSQIRQLRALPRNWDGYGADKVDVGRLNNIAWLLASYLPKHTPPGSLVPGADGSLQAEWHLRKGSFGLLIEKGEAISAWSRPRGSETELEEHGYEALNLLQAAALGSRG